MAIQFEPVFKVYKQKELLEDAPLMHRVQRAIPNVECSYIDVGNMPITTAARAHLERIKNEIHQSIDSFKNRWWTKHHSIVAYNPLSIHGRLLFCTNG